MSRRPRFGINRVDAWRQPIGATLDPSIVERARRGDLEAFDLIVADRIGAVYRLSEINDVSTGGELPGSMP